MSTSHHELLVAQGSRKPGLVFLKRLARKLLACHIPVGGAAKPFFRAGYQLHCTARATLGWGLRFLWYEPLFRSQCTSVGKRFRMEQLPYIVGKGRIVIGDDVQFSGKPCFTLSANYAALPNLTIGSGSFLGHNCAMILAREISIGSHCLIAGNVRLCDFDGHSLDHQARREGRRQSIDSVRPVLIGDDVWIGHGALILKGVTIGDRAIIGARAVVTSDVAADTVVAGNPARVVKQLDSHTRQFTLHGDAH